MIEPHSVGIARRERLRAARVYFVVESEPPGRPLAKLLEAALVGGVDMLQLRDKQAGDERLLEAAGVFRRACDAHGALFWLNDRPDLALAAGADGVHVGQDDVPVERVRRQVGEDLLVGLSTHTQDQLEAGLRSGADQLSVGPVYETPTKEGRPAAGLDYVRYAARTAGAERPWFAIGGIDRHNVRDVLGAGARRIAVVRAIRDAGDPRAAAAGLRAALERGPVGAGR